jgi:hypothetical protein
MELSFSTIRARLQESMRIRRRRRREAMIEGISRSCRVKRENVAAIITPEAILPSEPFVKKVMRGDVILIEGKHPMALEVKSVDPQGMTILAREEGMTPAEHRLKPGDNKEVWRGNVTHLFIADICTLSVTLAPSGASLEFRTELTGGLMPF